MYPERKERDNQFHLPIRPTPDPEKTPPRIHNFRERRCERRLGKATNFQNEKETNARVKHKTTTSRAPHEHEEINSFEREYYVPSSELRRNQRVETNERTFCYYEVVTNCWQKLILSSPEDSNFNGRAKKNVDMWNQFSRASYETNTQNG